MRRITFAVVAVLGFSTAPARADTLPIIEGVPNVYTPGTAFTFDVRVPQLADFNAYAFDLVFSTTVVNPPLLAFPTVADPVPTGRYVFPNSSNFSYTLNTPPGSTDISLSISDFTGSGVLTIPSVNDTLVRVTVLPDVTMRGTITITASDVRFDYNMEGADFGTPDGIEVLQGEPSNGNPVPAPPGALLLGIGGVLLFARRALSKQAV